MVSLSARHYVTRIDWRRDDERYTAFVYLSVGMGVAPVNT
jgi:hypothetical protein